MVGNLEPAGPWPTSWRVVWHVKKRKLMMMMMIFFSRRVFAELLHIIVWRLAIRDFPEWAWSPSTRIVWGGRHLCGRNKDLAFPTVDPQPFPQIITRAPPSNGTQEAPSSETSPTSTDGSQAPSSNEPRPYHDGIARPPPTYTRRPNLEEEARLQPLPPMHIHDHAAHTLPSSSSHGTQGPESTMQIPMHVVYPNTISLLRIAIRDGTVSHLGLDA